MHATAEGSFAPCSARFSLHTAKERVLHSYRDGILVEDNALDHLNLSDRTVLLVHYVRFLVQQDMEQETPKSKGPLA